MPRPIIATTSTRLIHNPHEETFARTTLVEDDVITETSMEVGLFLKSLVVAGISGATAEFITFPIDTTKVYLQLINKPNNNDVYNTNQHHLNVNNTKYFQTKKQIAPSRNVGLSSYYYAMCDIYRNSGLKGFYRGYQPALLRASFNNALSATFYKRIRTNLFGCDTRDCPFYIKCYAGFITGGATQILAAPVDLLKVRLQADSIRSVPRYNGLLDALTKIYNKHGILAFYRGLWPSIVRAGLSVAATFGSYDHCKAYILRVMKWEDNVKTHSVSSAVSGLIATLVSCPFDVVKTRYQSQSITNPLYKSPRQCFSMITKQEGFSVLYRGFGPMYFRLAPWQLSFFIVFEALSKHVIGETF